MPITTKIEWTESTWNPVTGCIPVSEGCDNCYAKELAERMTGPAFPRGFDLTLRPHKLRDPIKWKEPRRIFVNSMSDLFLGSIPPEYLKEVWDTMLEANHHTYQVLTKRPIVMARRIKELDLTLAPNIWLGVSVESQRWANERIPQLLDIGAPVNFLSCEPLLGLVDLGPWLSGLQWVIDGGESGPTRRPADPDWFRYLRDQCLEADVAYFHKQGNARFSGKDRYLDGRTWDEYPTTPEPVKQFGLW